MTRARAGQDARKDYGKCSALEIARAVGSFTDDPPDSYYQRTYLKELIMMLREKLEEPKRGPMHPAHTCPPPGNC